MKTRDLVWWLLTVFVFGCVCAAAAELRLPPSPVAPHTLIRLAVVDAAEVEDVMVMTARNSEVSFVDLEQSATSGTYVFTGPPGVYSIRVKCKGVSPLVGRVEVAGTGPFPPVPPQPPTPPVPPTPISRQLTAVILHESGQDTAAWARLWNELQTSGTVAQFLTGKGHLVRILDDDLPQAAQYTAATADRPGVVLIDRATQSVVHSGSCPATADGILGLLKQHGG